LRKSPIAEKLGIREQNKGKASCGIVKMTSEEGRSGKKGLTATIREDGLTFEARGGGGKQLATRSNEEHSRLKSER